MPDDIAQIYEEAERFKATLLKRERAAASRMIRVYGQSWSRLSKLLMAVTEKIGEAQRRGQPISPAWLFQQERFARLMVQVEREMRKFADVAERSIVAEQAAAVKAALADSTALAGRVAAATPGITATFTALPVSAVESIAGFLGNGSPLRALLDELPADAGKVVADLLQEGIALGYNPRKTAAKIRHAMGMHLNRALMIARTETLRAYREATIQNYRANDDVVMGWWWTASLSRRTCPSCIALHGTWHPLSERMESHPRCRCTQIPGTKDSPPPLEKGTEWFAKQDEATQRAILVNNATFNAYKDGKIALQDLVGRRIDPRWGSTYHHLSLKRALNGEGKFPGYNWPAESGLPIGGALPVKVLPDLPPAFVPAKTIKEAEEWAVKQGIAKSVTYAGLQLADVNRVNRALSEAWQTWQLDPLRHINNVVKGSTRARASGQRLEFNPLELGGPDRDLIYQRDVLDYSRLAKEREIRLERLLQGPLTEQQRAEFTSSLGKVRESLKYGRWSVKSSADDAVANTFLHETGHVIADQYLGHTNEFVIKNVANPGVLDEARKWKAEWLDLFQQRGADAYKISQYAVTNEREYFAECFVMYNTERAKLPKRIVDYFDRLNVYANKKPVSKL